MSQQVGAVQRLDKSRIAVDVRADFPVGGDMRVRKAIRAKVPGGYGYARVIDRNNGIGRWTGYDRLVHSAGSGLDHDRR